MYVDIKSTKFLISRDFNEYTTANYLPTLGRRT